MRVYTRIIFGLNFLYQLLAGSLFLFLPVLSIGLYGFPSSDANSMAAHVGIRVMGLFMVVAGIVSFMITRNPDKNPVLLPIMAIISVLTLLCWFMALSAHEMTLGQVALDLAVQVLLLVGSIGYFGTAKRKFRESLAA
jgi:hypothetical protein